MVKNLPGDAGATGWIPGQGTKILHAAEQLSLSLQLPSSHASVRESACHNDPLMGERGRRDSVREEFSLGPTTSVENRVVKHNKSHILDQII